MPDQTQPHAEDKPELIWGARALAREFISPNVNFIIWPARNCCPASTNSAGSTSVTFGASARLASRYENDGSYIACRKCHLRFRHDLAGTPRLQGDPSAWREPCPRLAQSYTRPDTGKPGQSP